MPDELLDAVTAGIAMADSGASPAPEAPENPEPSQAPESSETPAAPSGPEATAEPEGGDEQAPDSAAESLNLDEAGRVRNGKGRFASLTEKKPAEAAKPSEQPKPGDPAKPTEPPKPIEPPKPVDVVNDPIPEGLKAGTRERMTKLVETAKTLTAERQQAVEDRDLLLKPIEEAGATLEQFQESVGLLRLINSRDLNDNARAYQHLMQAANVLAQRIGVVPPGQDPLQGHPDLQQRVQAGTIHRQDAEELAKGRMRDTATQQHTQRMQQLQQQTAAQQQAEQQARSQSIQSGRAAVAQLESTFMASDPHAGAKIAMLKQDQTLLAQFRQMDPAQWGVAFASAYAKLPAPRPAAAPVGAPPQQPLRPRAPAGGTLATPQSMLEAVTAGIALAGG